MWQVQVIFIANYKGNKVCEELGNSRFGRGYKNYRGCEIMQDLTGILESGEEYAIVNIEIYTRGDLEGYLNGYVEINDKWYELLFRIKDRVNGEDNTLVSIDYGWKAGFTENDFINIENQIIGALIDEGIGLK